MTITVNDVDAYDKALDLMIGNRETYATQVAEAIANVAGFRNWCDEEHQRLMQAKRDNDALLMLLAGKKSTASVKDMNQTKDKPPEPWFMKRAREAGVSDHIMYGAELPSYEDGTKMPNDPTDPMYKHAAQWHAFETGGNWSHLIWDAQNGRHAYHFKNESINHDDLSRADG